MGITLGGRVALFAAQSRADLRQGRKCSGFTGGDHFRRLGEIVPHKGLYVWLDDDVGLRAPREIGVALENVERAAENVCECTRLLQGARLEIHGDNNVGAEEQSALQGHGSGEKSIDQSSSIVLDRHEQPWISARSANHGRKWAMRVIHGDAGV